MPRVKYAELLRESDGFSESDPSKLAAVVETKRRAHLATVYMSTMQITPIFESLLTALAIDHPDDVRSYLKEKILLLTQMNPGDISWCDFFPSLINS